MARGDAKRDREIIDEARERFKWCEDWEEGARKRQKLDLKFGEGDSENNWQWPTDVTEERGKKPSLTINKARQHCLQIINDARQNKPQIRIQPVSDGASKEAAQVFEGICRHIEYISDAQTAYDTATYHQVFAGMGYLRIATRWITDSFDQEIYIERVNDPFSIYLDVDIKRYDGSDARYAFDFLDMKWQTFEKKYPEYKGRVNTTPLSASDDWSSKDNIRVAKYFRRKETKDQLMEVPPGLSAEQPQGGVMRRSELHPEIAKQLDVQEARSRDVTDHEIEWFVIAGSDIVDRGVWAGSYIPIIRIPGEETIIEGNLDRKGHIRALKDAQRAYNYAVSSYIEHVALQTKTPWMGPVEHYEENKGIWQTANTVNHSYLPIVRYDDAGREIPPPQRIEPPKASEGYIQGIAIAAQDLMLASGQYQAEMGAPSNERSGVAINARQRQADNATYHYVDHLAQGVRFAGRQLVDLIPKIYDTARVLRILGEDGSEDHVQLQPEAPHGYQEVDKPQDGAQPGGQPQGAPGQPAQGQPDVISGADVSAIFNPNVGKFEVIADIGPAYATKRQEAFNAFTQIMQHNPQAFQLAGDLMFKAADFPMSDELAERMQKMLPPQLQPQSDAPTPQQAQQMAQQMHQMMDAHQQLQQQYGVLQQKLNDKTTEQQHSNLRDQLETVRLQQSAELERYKAETARMAAAGGIDPEAMKLVVREEVSKLLGMPAVPLIAAHTAVDQAMQPQPEQTNGAGQ